MADEIQYPMTRSEPLDEHRARQPHLVGNDRDVRGATATHWVDSNERQALRVSHDRHSSLPLTLDLRDSYHSPVARATVNYPDATDPHPPASAARRDAQSRCRTRPVGAR